MLVRELTETVYGNQLVLYDEAAAEDSFERSMVVKNEIPGFIPADIQNRNGRECFVYDLSGRLSVWELYQKKEITCDGLEKIFEGHKRLYQSLSEYLLDPSGILLSPENIFADTLRGELSFVYFPGFGGDFSGELRELWEYLLWRIDHKDQKAVRAAYQFYSRLIQGDYSVDEFLGEERSPTKKEPSGEEISAERNEYIQNEDKEVREDEVDDSEKRGRQRHIERKTHSSRVTFMISGISLVILITSVILIYFFGSDGLRKLMYDRWAVAIIATIGAVLMLAPFLSVNREYKEKHGNYPGNRSQTYEGHTDKVPRQSIFFSRDRSGSSRELRITHIPAVIGKSAEADIVIEKRAVSRRHAKILRREGEYYLADLDSTNGTFLNGVRLVGNERAVLKSGDEVRFADEIFYFFCYDNKE
ncbi:MAG: FHA domain-containing protein [Lachnospiraceae bacterium]|nr:FHA domain-containing protein [Lachnospiraceae bacterium]